MKKIRGYMFSRLFMGERVPQHIQNQVIRTYCIQNNFEYLLSAVEYSMRNSTLMLNQIFNETKNLDGIGFYSLFQLPESDIERNKFLKKILKKKKFVFFAVENIILSSSKDVERIENIWLIKKILNSCLTKEDFKNAYER
ncbi:MAG: sporadic carbohydrate cluster protein, LIC12192 family [Legionellales bacterium]|nr:sporadic carbohydrate cluster protein, LIC12192 family [Legionellales bacterium]|tara:strand:- start:3802 stop:4221 length:420 start_codon:yes stop_codon:yes gene_type:complete